MPKHALTIDVLGCSLQISADEEPEYLNNLLETYKEKLEEIGKTTGLKDPTKIAILTGFILCDEAKKNRANIETQKTGTDEETKEAENLTLNLISKLEDVLGIDETGKNEKEVFKLQNTIKHFDWGSPVLLPDLLGMENETGVPWAELWMGIHPEGPSAIDLPNFSETGPEKKSILLSDLISGNPDFFLGKNEKRFSTLPFLFKALAAGKPLSIQAHPNLPQAREGWERENRDGIPLDSPHRNYKDANHKPEIICALTPFTAMAGFRQPDEIMELLGFFLEGASRDLKAAFFPLLNTLEEKEAPLKKFLAALLALPRDIKTALSVFAGQKAKADNSTNDEWKLIAAFAENFPGDPAIISPLYLNLVHLNPTEAIFIPAGILHAYVEGLGVELMANSDNVMRGGLTAKHIDIPELFRILDFEPYKPEILTENKASGYHKYPVYCREFSLSVIRDRDFIYPETGPSIVLVTRGELKISGKFRETFLKKGETAFIPAKEKNFRFEGSYTLYAAGTGSVTEA